MTRVIAESQPVTNQPLILLEGQCMIIKNSFKSKEHFQSWVDDCHDIIK